MSSARPKKPKELESARLRSALKFLVNIPMALEGPVKRKPKPGKDGSGARGGVRGETAGRARLAGTEDVTRVNLPAHSHAGHAGMLDADQARVRKQLIKNGLRKGVSFFSSANTYPVCVFSVLPYDPRLEKTLNQRR